MFFSQLILLFIIMFRSADPSCLLNMLTDCLVAFLAEKTLVDKLLMLDAFTGENMFLTYLYIL